MGELYRLDFPSGKSYIGVSFTTAIKRYAVHEGNARRGNQQLLYRAWRKYGTPKLVVLAVLKREELWPTEQRAILAFGTFMPRGYNMTEDGKSPPLVTKEAAGKIAARLRGRSIPEEVRKKIGLANLGKKRSAESRAKISSSQKGRVMTKEHRAKLAAAKLGTTRPQQVRMKMAVSQRARRLREGCVPRNKCSHKYEVVPNSIAEMVHFKCSLCGDILPA